MKLPTARRFFMVVTVCVLVVACAEPLEFPDWTIPVPEGTRIIEHLGVPVDERAGPIELVEDLAVGGEADDPNRMFYRPADLAVDDDGRMYVLDRGNYRVQVFDAQGTFLASWGRQGEGPGELLDPRWIAVAGDRVAILAGAQRLSVWGVGEGHVADHRFPEARVASLAGTPEGALAVAFHTYSDTRQAPDSRRTAVGLFTLEGQEVADLGAFDDPSSIFEISTKEGVAEGLLGPRPSPSVAVGPQGRVYLTGSGEYQVLAASPAGNVEWALRIAGRREPLSEDDREAWLSPLRERFEQVIRFDVDWPERKPALAGLQVDGHGHLYVYPFVLRATRTSEVPVDVYTADGSRLFSGTIVNRRWRAAHGSFVYDLERDLETQEMKVVRYRLVEPFQ